MKKLIIICTLIEILIIFGVLYILSRQDDYVCSRDATTTPVAIERPITIPGEIEEPIYIFTGDK